MSTTVKNNGLPVAIEVQHVHGLRPEVIGNIHFNLNREVIYPVEGVLAFHDYVENKQRFLKLPPNTAPKLITLNTTRLLMAVVEVTKTDEQERLVNIVVYDLLTLHKERTFQLPNSARGKRITGISFTCDSNALAVLTEYPDEMMYMLFFDKLGTTIEGRAGNANRRGIASMMSCNPQIPDLIAVCGDGIMKLLVKSEKGVTLKKEITSDFSATSIAWISVDMFFVGTKQGRLILFENGKKKATFRAKEVEKIDVTARLDTEDAQDAPPIPGAKSEAIVCMIAFPKGLAFAIFNEVYVFERISNTKFERKTILNIPMVNYAEKLYQISNMAINAKQDTVIVTPKHSQIYVGVLIVPESLHTKILEFQTLGELAHIDEIVDMSICLWRPIVVTCSKDKTVRVWNYKTGNVELVKRFNVQLFVVELFLTGQFVAIGFKEKISIMDIFMDDLNHVKTYSFPSCKAIKFSHLGHFGAAAYGSTIAILSVVKLETLRNLKGQSGTFLSIAWARNDKSIFSISDDGTLIQWDIETGARLQEVSEPNTKYLTLCITNDSNCFYAATDSGILRKFCNSKVIHETQLPVQSAVLDLALSRSDLIMFAATKKGHLYNVHMPLAQGSSATFTKYSLFESGITKLRFSYDETMLISCSANGTLVIWQLKNIEGRVSPIDQDLLKSQEVLIPRADLEAKIARIKALEAQIKQQATEFYQRQSQNEENDQQQMADLHRGYCEALLEMKAKNSEIGARHAEELIQITSQIDELNTAHKIDMDNLSVQYSERMIAEYQKFSKLRENMLRIRDNYEQKLTESRFCLNDTVIAIEADFKKQLEERQELIKQLLEEMEDKRQEFIEYCHQVEVDNDRKMIDCQIEYEKKVQFERDETAKWKNQAEAHQLKFNNIRRECDALSEEVEKLRDEHFKSKAYIGQLRIDINDLHHGVADREEAIIVKEHRIDEIQLKNVELEKYKQVLNYKIDELKAQIEPREMQITEKRKQIAEMEHELNGLHKNNLQLELQVKELKDKCLSVSVELKTERERAKAANLCVTDMRSEIYQLASNMDQLDKLKEGIKMLFRKYSNDDALKIYVSLDTQPQADLHKLRAHIEKIMLNCKQKVQQKSYLGQSKKLKTENKILVEEAEEARYKNERLSTEIQNMKVLVKLFSKTKVSKEQKKSDEDTDTFVDIEKIKKYFVDQMRALEIDIQRMKEENGKLKEELETKLRVRNQ